MHTNCTDSAPSPRSSSDCHVAVWGLFGAEHQIAQVLRNLCEKNGLNVQVHVPSKVCNICFPQFNPELTEEKAAKLSMAEQREATDELRHIFNVCNVWLGWPQGSWKKVENITGGFPPNLKWIETLSAGADELLPVVPSRVLVSRAEGKFDASIAEWVLQWIFMHAKKALAFLEHQRQQKWQKEFGGITRVSGAQLLIVGYGSIGRTIANLCKAVGMKVKGTRRSAKTTIVEDDVSIHPSQDLHQLLAEADYVVLALPLTSETRLTITEKELVVLKKGAALINIARGEIVDWPAISSALQKGSLAGYYTDVTVPEPLPDGHPDWKLPNLVVTPHNAWAPSPSPSDDAERFFPNLQRFLSNSPIHGLVDPTRGY